MANELARTYKADGIEVNLNPQAVLSYMIDPAQVHDRNGNCLIPPREMMKVIATCQARSLNPFTGDVIVQPRRNKDGSFSCTLVVTKDFYIRRAAASPLFDGKECGIIVKSKDGRPVRREGTCVYYALGEELLGGWCRVHIKGREVAEYAEVSLREYDQQQALWKTKPATMICKVAVSQALRAAFPNDFNGTYEPEEIGFEQPQQQPLSPNEVEFPHMEPPSDYTRMVSPPEHIEPMPINDQEPIYEQEF